MYWCETTESQYTAGSQLLTIIILENLNTQHSNQWCSRKYLGTGAVQNISSRRVSRNSQEGGPKSESLFFQFFKGGAAQKIAEKMIFSTKKVAKYR